MLTEWLDAEGRFFHPAPSVRVVPLPYGSHCVVVDDALANPEGVRQWAAAQAFRPPTHFPYPGLVFDTPATLAHRMAEFFTQHAREPLGGRRTLTSEVRLSLLNTRPEALPPQLWQCHRDVLERGPHSLLCAASVLYLFHEPALGGTSIYRPLRDAAETDRMLKDSEVLDAATFSARHGVAPGYMTGSNAYFERVAKINAAWNRAIFYDGSLFHAPDVDQPELISDDVLRGRLTLNGFFGCKRQAA